MRFFFFENRFLSTINQRDVVRISYKTFYVVNWFCGFRFWWWKSIIFNGNVVLVAWPIFIMLQYKPCALFFVILIYINIHFDQNDLYYPNGEYNLTMTLIYYPFFMSFCQHFRTGPLYSCAIVFNLQLHIINRVNPFFP